MKKALIVGIGYYENSVDLPGAPFDACAVKSVMACNDDGTTNFDTLLEVATERESSISKCYLRSRLKKLFEDKSEVALFYFSGHGHIENQEGYLVTSECKRGSGGVSMNELIQIANDSPATNKVIVLDCCHSGAAANSESNKNKSILSDGLTILAAASSMQRAIEKNNSGIFTTLFIDALKGGAANLMGEITPGSIYAFIDRSLSSWEQRPIFKTNITRFIALRKVKPLISINDLKAIVTIFPAKNKELKLDPSFEPERSPYDSDRIPKPIEDNVRKFKILQAFNRMNLLTPIDAPHMWHVAMQSKSCKLTPLGIHYWELVRNGRI